MDVLVDLNDTQIPPKPS